MSQKARKQYKKEAEEIEKAHAAKDKKNNLAEKDFKRKVEKLNKSKIKKEKDLEVERRRSEMRLVKDQEAIDAALKESGIDEV